MPCVRGRNKSLQWVESEKGLTFVTRVRKEEIMCPDKGSSRLLPIKNVEIFCSCEM